MSASPLTILKRYRSRLTATMAAVAILSGGVVALTAGAASALPIDDCAAYRTAVTLAGQFFGMYTTDVLEGYDEAAYWAYNAYQNNYALAMRIKSENPGC